MGVMEFRLTEVDRRIAERLQRLSAVKALVTDRPEADPIIRGTDISVYVIAALARGQTVAASRTIPASPGTDRCGGGVCQGLSQDGPAATNAQLQADAGRHGRVRRVGCRGR
jgi:hypothetical protein